MEQISLLEHTKKDVRSILNACGKQMTVDELNRKYSQLIGTNVPFSKLGYKSLAEFLRSVPDVVRVVKNGYDLFVYPIESEFSGHILALNRNTAALNKQNRNGRRRGNHGNQFRT